MMHSSPRRLLGAALLTALMATGAGAAHAGTTSTNFSASMPHLQGDWNSAAQTKTSAKAAGSVKISTVGASYGANARMCYRDNHGNCGTELKNLKGGSTGSLANGFAKGNAVVLQLHETPYALVAVSATGSWKSN